MTEIKNLGNFEKKTVYFNDDVENEYYILYDNKKYDIPKYIPPTKINREVALILIFRGKQWVDYLFFNKLIKDKRIRYKTKKEIQ